MEFNRLIICGIIVYLYLCLDGTFSTDLRCYRSFFENYDEVPLEESERLINSSDPCINVSLCSLIYIFGLGGEPTGFAVTTLIPTFLNQRKYNVLLLNWEDAASGKLLGIILGYPTVVVPATKSIGEQFGRELIKLIDMGLRKDCIHIVGHSLGAHLAGYTGRETIRLGYQLPWITALDPARPQFEPALFTQPLDSSCAKFVDCIHCDPGGYGVSKSVGHVDFWPNQNHFEKGNQLQPGCNKSLSPIDLATNGNSCNHNFCVRLYNASFAEPKILEGVKAASYQDWLDNNTNNNQSTNYIGLHVKEDEPGNFYLSTTGEYPFGKGTNGFRPDNTSRTSNFLL